MPHLGALGKYLERLLKQGGAGEMVEVVKDSGLP